MITVGSYTIPSRIILAPLSGVSDLAFRLIAREHGARFCFFEMVDAHSLVYERARKTAAILQTNGKDMPVAAQLLGADPDMMLRAAKKLLGIVRTPFLDINAACPARKVVGKEAGSHLLLRPDTLAAVIRKLAANLPVPVTVKIRIGYDAPDIAAIGRIAKLCESSGASAIFVHGRTRAQGYAGAVDYDSIRAVKDAVKVPVIASGNIFNGPLAKRMFERTACDGVLVARGAMGKPWVFGEIDEYLRTGAVPPPVDLATKKLVLGRHLAYIEEYKDLTPSGKVGYMRKFAMWYLRGIPDATTVRSRICTVRTCAEMRDLVESIAEEAEREAVTA